MTWYNSQRNTNWRFSRLTCLFIGDKSHCQVRWLKTLIWVLGQTFTSQTEDDCSLMLMEQMDNQDTPGEHGTLGGQGPPEEGRRQTDRQGRHLSSPWTTHSGAINISLFVHTAMPTFPSRHRSQSPEQFEVERTGNCSRVLETAIEACRDSVNKWWWPKASTSTGLSKTYEKKHVGSVAQVRVF